MVDVTKERRADYIDIKGLLVSDAENRTHIAHMADGITEINKTLLDIKTITAEDKEKAAEDKIKNEHRHTKTEANVRLTKRIAVIVGGTAIGKWAYGLFNALFM